MKTLKIMMMLMAVAIMAACGPSRSPDKESGSDEILPPPPKDTASIEVAPSTDTLQMRYDKLMLNWIQPAEIRGLSHRIAFAFAPEKGKKITLDLTSADPKMNTRILEIINPKGIKTQVKDKPEAIGIDQGGTWYIIVGEDNTKEAWRGKFNLLIRYQ